MIAFLRANTVPLAACVLAAFVVTCAATVAVCAMDAASHVAAAVDALEARQDVGALGGTAPPPYTDPSVTTTNALGGFGRTEGWLVTFAATTKDLFADAQIPASIKTEVEAVTTTSNVRWFYVTLTSTVAASEAVCVRLGPATDSPTLTTACPDTNAGAGVSGGCYLSAQNQVCGPIELRPILSCASYDACHVPVWAVASQAGGVTVNVTEAW